LEIPRRAGGSHRKWLNPDNLKATTVPDWGSRVLKIGTLRAVVKQLGIDWIDFENT
jgi:mRNA interferase HicA